MTTYQAMQVWPALTPYVAAILVQEDAATDGLDAPVEPVMPTPFPVLGYQFRGRLAVLRDGEARLLAGSGITVLQSDARTFVPHADARSVLVTLQPSAAYRLLGYPMHELADQHVGLADLLGAATMREVQARLEEARTTAERGAVVQRHLLRQFRETRTATHVAVDEAVRRTVGSGGRMRVMSLAADLGVSERQLERLFREQVGASPKQFASLVQFDWAWRRAQSGLPLSSLAADAGYADQAHLTRIFVQRTGLPPARLLRRASGIRVP